MGVLIILLIIFYKTVWGSYKKLFQLYREAPPTPEKPPFTVLQTSYLYSQQEPLCFMAWLIQACQSGALKLHYKKSRTSPWYISRNKTEPPNSPLDQQLLDIPKSKLIFLLSIVYGLFAIVGVYVAVLGYYSKPEHLHLIDETGNKPEQLELAKRIMEQAQKEQPNQVILNMFYKGWLLEYDYKDLKKYQQPLYEGDSFEKRLKNFNDSSKRIPHIYQDAVTALAFLSTGGLVLVIIMLRTPGYFVSVVLAGFPVLVVFTCAVLGINYDPLEYCWIPFIALGGIIFFLQFIFSFRFGRPEHRTIDGMPGLIIYRRGLLLLNLGIFILVGSLLMATGSISGSGHSMRTGLVLALFGEEGVVIIGFIVGIIMVILGLCYLLKKPLDEGGTKLKIDG